MIQLAPPVYDEKKKTYSVHNLKAALKNCLAEIAQVKFLKSGVKIKKMGTVEKILRQPQPSEQKIIISVHFDTGSRCAAAEIAKYIQEKIFSEFKLITACENIAVNTYIEKSMIVD